MCCKWHCLAPAWGRCVFCRCLLSQALRDFSMCRVVILLRFPPDACPRAGSRKLLPGALAVPPQWRVLYGLHTLCWGRPLCLFVPCLPTLPTDSLLFPWCSGNPPGPLSLRTVTQLPKGQAGSCTNTLSCKARLPTLCSEIWNQGPVPWP